VPFAQLLEQRIHRPVWLENDVNAISWGEFRFGAAKGVRDAVCVFVGTGVGGGAVLGGELYRGAHNTSMEIGHLRCEEDGRRCGCGARGCLEAYAGGRHLAEIGQEAPTRELLDAAGGDPTLIHAGHLDQAAQAGDDYSHGILARGGRYLGHALASTVTLLNPATLVLGGTIWTQCETLRNSALASFEALVNPSARGGLEIADAELGDDAGVLGAADLGWRCSVARKDSERC
jgi:glucokinase